MDYFIAVDVETANRERGSICQIGLVCFNGDGIEWQWSTLVNPECDFEPHNIRIHRITPHDVAAAPKWPAVFECIADSLSGQMVASHTNFDEYALMEACQRYGLPPPRSHWFDSHALARRTWPEFRRHGLAELCAAFDIELNHHDALSDAMACGRIVKLCLAGTRVSAAEMERQALATGTPGQTARRGSNRPAIRKMSLSRGRLTGRLPDTSRCCQGSSMAARGRWLPWRHRRAVASTPASQRRGRPFSWSAAAIQTLGATPRAASTSGPRPRLPKGATSGF